MMFFDLERFRGKHRVSSEVLKWQRQLYLLKLVKSTLSYTLENSSSNKLSLSTLLNSLQ